MVYLDNAATTFPKPKSVIERINYSLINLGANPGRGGYDMSMHTSEAIYDCRRTAQRFFNVPGVERVIFTFNCTHSINIALKGILKRGDHVILTNIEHNAVIRCVNELKERGVTNSIAQVEPCNNALTLHRIESLIRNNTRVIVCTHASNVFGIRMPIEQIGLMCKKHGIFFVVDAAQSAGVLPIDIKRMHISALCVPGHKGLYGPMGTGMLMLNEGVSIRSLIQGGTGSNSASLVQPQELPEALESGTVNTSGIIGLKAGMEFVMHCGIDRIRSHESRLITKCYEHLHRNNKIRLYMPKPDSRFFVPLLSFNVDNMSSFDVASQLGSQDIAVRAGLHCAPLAHKAFGTFEIGTVRICPSIFTTDSDIEALKAAVDRITA